MYFVNRDRCVGGRSCLHLQSGVKTGRERDIETLRVPNKINVSVRLLKSGFGSKIKLLKSYIILHYIILNSIIILYYIILYYIILYYIILYYIILYYIILYYIILYYNVFVC